MATKQDLYKVAWFIGTIVILLFALESVWFVKDGLPAFNLIPLQAHQLCIWLSMAAAVLLFTASYGQRKKYFAGYLWFMATEISLLAVLHTVEIGMQGLKIIIWSLFAFLAWLYVGASQIQASENKRPLDIFWKYFVSVLSLVGFNLFALFLFMQLHPK